MLTNLIKSACGSGGGQARNIPLAFLEVNYTILANQAVTADDRANARNRKILR
jgi:hypothetical protein